MVFQNNFVLPIQLNNKTFYKASPRGGTGESKQSTATNSVKGGGNGGNGMNGTMVGGFQVTGVNKRIMIL